MTGWDAAERDRVADRVDALVGRLPGTETDRGPVQTGYLVRGRRYAVLMVDHHGDGRLALWVKAPPGEQEALTGTDPGRYFVPPYLGPRGWVGVRLDDAAGPDWDEVAALLDQAWRLTAGSRAVAAADRATDLGRDRGPDAGRRATP